MENLTDRKKQARETESKIYESALRLFSERGYDGVRVADICEDAGVAVGVFYHYFPSKYEVLVKSYERAYDYIKEKVANEKYIKSVDKIKETVSQFSKIFAYRGVKYSGIFLNNELFNVSSYFDAENNMQGFLKELVEEAVDNGELKGNIERISLDIFKVIRGSMYVAVLKGNIKNLEKETLQFLKVTLSYYKVR